ncbi:uncharacterized protein LOC124443679 isoform X2 [Xenia sp. Carnegie-2017]|uniref:uncharacterized protein LOC124443679 isoform X2 n=1 Tax=Xenia sp. Carnegie-2017 TaxID=2897299 RepID=UPI001F0482D2|nr:uncharacterized protein LOC124443679 isoform X2 [Xenia sp. Carnegie-2017]
MLRSERNVIDKFAVDLKSDVLPIDLLPFLTCLTEDDREQIQCKQDREGPRSAVTILLDRLKKREKGFEQFLSALEDNGCKHLQKMLSQALQKSKVVPDEKPKLPPMTSKDKTNSDPQSKSLKTPTTETSKQSFKTSSVPKKSTKKMLPKENTTSPPKPKTDAKVQNEEPFVKLVRNTEDKNIPKEKSDEESHNTTMGNSDTDSISKYDTFICYAKKNSDVAVELKTFLENEYLKVCIDFENFIPGATVLDNICESINSSGSTIFLLSPAFHTKKWAKFELEKAILDYNKSRELGKLKKIIPVLLEECEVPSELEMFTEIDMKRFDSRQKGWQKLAEAIGHKSLHSDNLIDNDAVVNNVESVDEEISDEFTRVLDVDGQEGEEKLQDDNVSTIENGCHSELDENKTNAATSDDPSENDVYDNFDEEPCAVCDDGITENVDDNIENEGRSNVEESDLIENENSELSPASNEDVKTRNVHQNNIESL